MKMRIRAIQIEDACAIARIIRDLGWFEHLTLETEQATEERVRRHIALCLADRSHSSYVAEDESGRVVGYASVHFLPYFFLLGPEGYISELFVGRESRGRGAGTALLNAIVDEARRRGCSRLSLINSRTRESYKRRYYEQRDWKERPEVAAFILPLTLADESGAGDTEERTAGNPQSDIE